MTLVEARKQLAVVGMTISKQGSDYCVRHKGVRDPDAAYYTNDLADAVATGILMAKVEKPAASMIPPASMRLRLTLTDERRPHAVIGTTGGGTLMWKTYQDDELGELAILIETWTQNGMPCESSTEYNEWSERERSSD